MLHLRGGDSGEVGEGVRRGERGWDEGIREMREIDHLVD